MRNIFQSVLILTFLSFPVTAQTIDACAADVRHLKLPEHALIDDVLGLEQPPLVFLFSQDGVDVYSATHFKAMQVFQKSGMQLANAFTVILVYQDEQVRQEKIEYVRKSFPYANLKNLDNLKFATFRFELLPVWVDDVLTRKWVISGMAYFKPVSCEPMESRMPASSQGYLEATIINGHNGIAGYTPLLPLPEGWPHYPPLSPPANSVLAKTLGVMQDLLKSYGLPN
jgi:hypothetical protein